MVNLDHSTEPTERVLRTRSDDAPLSTDGRDDRTSFARFLTVDEDKYAEVPCSD